MDKFRAFLNAKTTHEQNLFAWSCGTTLGYLRKRISLGWMTPKLANRIERESRGAFLAADIPTSPGTSAPSSLSQTG